MIMHFILILFGFCVMSMTSLTLTAGKDVRFVRTETSRYHSCEDQDFAYSF